MTEAPAAPLTTQTARGPRSLRGRLLTLLTAFSLGPLFLSNFWGYLVSRAYWADMAVRDVQHVARMEAARTLQAVTERRSVLLSMVAGDRHFLADLTRLRRADCGPAERDRLRQVLRDHLVARAQQIPSVGSLALISPVGDVIARSRGNAPDLGGDARCLDGPLDRARVLGLEPTGEDPTLRVAMPIRDGGGALVAVLCGQFRFPTHQSFVAANRDLGADSVLFLLDAHKQVLAGSGPPHPPGRRLESLRGRPQDLIGSTSGKVRRYDLSKARGEVIGAYEPVTQLGWGLLVEVPTRSVLAGIERLKWRAVLFGSAFAVLLIISIFVVTRSLSGQISRVAAAAKRIASGGLGERIEVDGPAEIQDLTRSFNTMSTALHESRQSLEDRIVERTRDLHESRELSELLLNSIEQRVIVVNLGGEIVKVNRTARTRYGDDLVGRHYSDVLTTHGDGNQNQSAITKTILSGAHQSEEHSEPTADGMEIVHWDTYPVRGELGMTSVIGIGRSITEEKRIQAQMLHHEKLASFGLLAAGVAHEIGNPLAAIESQLHMAHGAREPHRIDRTFEVVEAEVRRIGHLLRDLVDFSRRRRDRVVLISINQVIQDVARLLGHDPRSRNVQIELDLSDALPGVRGREDGLIQVLLNLGLNALDAMPEGGRLRFASRHEEGEVVIRVCDSGSGVAPELRDKIFEPFFTTKEPGRGTGLGLFVSRAVAAEFGGQLELEESGATGTIFAVRIVIDGSRSQARQP